MTTSEVALGSPKIELATDPPTSQAIPSASS